MSHGLLTDDELARLAGKAESYSDSNPFKARLLSRLGGLHKPSTATNDRHVMSEEPAVELLRDLPRAVAEGGTPF